MTADLDTALRLMATELAEALRQDAGAAALMQRLGLLAGPPAPPAPPDNTAEDSSPPRPARIGIWDPRGDAEPGAYVRSEALRSHWPYWADLPAIPARGERKRILLTGESVAYGFFYAPELTPARVLEPLVSAALGSAVEVVDLSRAGILAAELATLLGGVPALEPDLVVVFAGNNWLPVETPPPHTVESSLEATVLREQGVAAYKELREKKLFEQVANGLGRQLRKLSAAVPVVLLVPAFNLADWPLDPEVDAPWLSDGGNRRWLECRAAAREALAAGDLDRTRALAREMLALDQGTAGSGWVLLAECERRSGHLAEAHLCRERARDARIWDNNREATRTHGRIQEALRGCGSHDRISVVDLPEIFVAWQNGALPDRRLFLDLCHMSSQGIRVAMACAAREIARQLGGGALPLPTLEDLVSQAPGPSPRVEAEACFTAGVFNAHFGQIGPPMPFFLREAARRSPEVARIMWESLELQVRHAPFWTRTAAARISSALHTTQLRDRILSPGRDFFHAELLAAIADALEAEGMPARALVDELRREERSLSRVPQDMLSPYNAAFMVDRNAIWSDTHSFHRAYSPISRFPWVCREPAAVSFELTCRRTAEVTAPCRILVNDMPSEEMAPGPAWTTFRFTAPSGRVRAGVNWLEIRWSLDLPPGEDQISQAADDLENGRPYTLVPVFADIHSFTAVLA